MWEDGALFNSIMKIRALGGLTGSVPFMQRLIDRQTDRHTYIQIDRQIDR